MKNHIAFYTTQKAASTFLVHFLRRYSELTASEFYSVNDEKTRELIKEKTWAYILDNYSKSISKTTVYGPIRIDDSNPTFPDKIDGFCNIVHLRDPRDVLTSHFFSVVFSHPTRKNGFNLAKSKRDELGEQGIDNYVLDKSKIFKRRYEGILNKLYNKYSTFVTYEQLVTDFPGWLNLVMSAIYGDNIIAEIQNRLLNDFNHHFSVPGEDIFRHKRKIIPGDHKEKLKKETISKLNDIFKNELETLQNVYPAYGYI